MQAKQRTVLHSLGLAASGLTRLQAASLAALLLIVVAGGVTAYVRSRPRPIRISRAVDADEAASRRAVKVHVAGAVASPGLYDVPLGSRISDALAAAGGPSQDANLDELNLAAKVTDGQKILVPGAPQPVDGVNANTPVASPQTVNVNTATVAELETLPGVGPALAARIIEYRRKNGPFSSLEELDEVEGIGPGKLEHLEDRVTF